MQEPQYNKTITAYFQSNTIIDRTLTFLRKYFFECALFYLVVKNITPETPFAFLQKISASLHMFVWGCMDGIFALHKLLYKVLTNKEVILFATNHSQIYEASFIMAMALYMYSYVLILGPQLTYVTYPITENQELMFKNAMHNFETYLKEKREKYDNRND